MSQDRCSLHNRCFSMDYFSNSWVGHKISPNSRMKMTENTHFHLLGMGSLNGLMETELCGIDFALQATLLTQALD